MADPTLDALLRKFLEADPNEQIARLRVAVERVSDRMSEHSAECERYRQEVDERFHRLEHPSARPPTMGDLGKLVTSTGSWDTSAIDRVISTREAAAAFERQKAIVNAGGKIAIALIVAILLFAGGSFWRDLWGPRPSSTTSITTIAPAAPQR